VLGQDRVLDRPKEGRVHAHREQREQHQRDRHRVGQQALPGHQQAGRADQHDADLGGLDPADDHRLVAHVGELAAERREDEERQDEQARRDRAELRLRFLGIVDAVDDEQHHRVLEQVVVESVEQLRREQRQEAPLPQQVCRCQHDLPARPLTLRSMTYPPCV
jgi:hypothetical protein